MYAYRDIGADDEGHRMRVFLQIIITAFAYWKVFLVLIFVG